MAQRKSDKESDEKSDQLLLQRIVIENSQADNWIRAKTEWKLISIYDKDNTCICKHRILENCVIRNRHTNKELIVGNVCVNHFKEEHLTVPKSSRNSFRKVYGNPTSAKANKALIDVAVCLKILTAREGDIYIKSRKKTPKNLEFRQKINSLIKFGFIHTRPRCVCNELAKPRQNSLTKEYFYSCYYGEYANGNWTSQCEFTRSID